MRPSALAIVGALLWPATARAQRVCVEGVSVYGGSFDADLVEVLAQNSVTCVHVRLRQDLWTGLDDPMGRGDPPRTMLEVWDQLIDLYRARGIDVILEVGADALGLRTDALRDPATRARYASLFVRVVQRYVRQVKRFELADDGDLPPPAGVAGANALAPADVAALALTTQQALERGLTGSLCNLREVALGGVRYDSVAPGGVDYLWAVYAAGLGEDGSVGLWTEYRGRTHRLPFDVIAMHSFPSFISMLDTSSQGQGAASAAADAAGDVFARFEGGRAARPVWITAGGLPSDGSSLQNTRQRDWLMGYLDTAVRTDLSTPIALASWYAFIDPPWNRGDWGFYDDGVLQRSNQRTAGLLAFANDMARSRPQPNALLRWEDPPLRLAPGEVRRVHLRVTNYGPNNDDATWHPSDRIQVGAASSCPYAEDANQVRWTGFPSGGSSGAGVFDGRVTVPIARDWWVTVPRLVEWDITAPTDPGTYALSARLIWGDDQWFGQNATTTVVVVAPSMDASADAIGDVVTDAVESDPAAGEEAPVVDASDAGPDDADGVDAVDAPIDVAAIADDLAPTSDQPMPVDVDVAAARDTGCGCAAAGRMKGEPWALGLLGALALRRRRRVRRARCLRRRSDHVG